MKKCCIALVIIIIFQFYGCKDRRGFQDKQKGIHVIRNSINRIYKKIDYQVKRIFGREDQTELIGYPYMIDIDMTGNIYVLDKKRETVIKLDPDLIYITSIGQQGEGPGEFNYSSCMHTDRSNRLYVPDISRKIEIFNDRGEHEQTVKIDFVIDKLFIDKHTGVITIGYKKYPNTREKYYHLCDFSLKEKSYSDFFSKEQLFYDRFQTKGILLVSPLIVLFTGNSGDIYICSGDKYEILIYGKDRKLKKKIIKEYKPIPVSAKALKLGKDMLTKYNKKRKGFEKIARYQPVMKSFAIDEKEQIWVELYKPYNIWKNSYETSYDLFSKSGKYLFTVKIMEKILTPLLFKNNHVYFAAEDRAGEYLIKKIQIVPDQTL